MKRTLLYLAFALALLGLDIVSKGVVYRDLAPLIMQKPGEGIPIFQNFLGVDFFLGLTFNKGAAWGLFSNFNFLLILVRIAIVIALFIYLIRFCKNRALVFPFVLILTGAIGNILDFFLYGFVIDFFHFRFWGHSFPLFNVADALISIGVTILFFNLYFKKHARV
ncbi:MAG: signal peptidase II [Chlamydiales bacterium]|nr:signal peptidase II [Chlamydiales bacterium]